MTARQLLTVLECLPVELLDLHFECIVQEEPEVAGSLYLQDNRRGPAVLQLQPATKSKEGGVIYSEGWEKDYATMILRMRGG